MDERAAITEVKVVDVEKRRTKDSSGKNYVRMFHVYFSFVFQQLRGRFICSSPSNLIIIL